MSHLKMLCALGALSISSMAQAEIKSFYVGHDTLATLSSGAYAGLANPNQGRLTFLYAHAYPSPDEANNHFHGIGAYTYMGPVGTPVVVDTNANNRIPETYTAQAPLSLHSGSGIYSGKLTTMDNDPPEHYSDLELRAIFDLDGYPSGTGENYMFNSSGGRYQGVLDGTTVELELVSKSPELHIGTTDTLDILLNTGDTHVIGSGDAFSFTPVLWVNGGTPDGSYYAEFRLLNSGTSGVQDSGRFFIDVAVPEPSSLGVIALGGLVLMRRNGQRA